MQISLLIHEVFCKQKQCKSVCSSAKSGANNRGQDQPPHQQSLVRTMTMQISLLICAGTQCRSTCSSAQSEISVTETDSISGDCLQFCMRHCIVSRSDQKISEVSRSGECIQFWRKTSLRIGGQSPHRETM